jgi:hypothetical protein
MWWDWPGAAILSTPTRKESAVGSDEFVPALMVSVEDYPRASALADSVAPMLNVMAY